MALIPTRDLELGRGDDTSYGVTITNKTTGQPVNITGSTLFFTAKRNPDDLDSNAIIQVKQTTHTDPVNGKSSIIVSSAVSGDPKVVPGKYKYDIQWVDSSAKVKTILKGILTVDDDVTKSVS